MKDINTLTDAEASTWWQNWGGVTLADAGEPFRHAFGIYLLILVILLERPGQCQVGLGLGEAGLLLQGLLIGEDRLRELEQLHIGVTEVEVGIGRVQPGQAGLGELHRRAEQVVGEGRGEADARRRRRHGRRLRRRRRRGRGTACW